MSTMRARELTPGTTITYFSPTGKTLVVTVKMILRTDPMRIVARAADGRSIDIPVGPEDTMHVVKMAVGDFTTPNLVREFARIKVKANMAAITNDLQSIQWQGDVIVELVKRGVLD